MGSHPGRSPRQHSPVRSARHLGLVPPHGSILEHLPIIQGLQPVEKTWLSDSGEGNRPRRFPNVTGAPTPYNTLFAELYTKYTGQPMKSQPIGQAPQLLASKVPPLDEALLIPSDPSAHPAVGAGAASDGTAWLYAPASGDYFLAVGPKAMRIRLAPGDLKRILLPESSH